MNNFIAGWKIGTEYTLSMCGAIIPLLLGAIVIVALILAGIALCAWLMRIRERMRNG